MRIFKHLFSTIVLFFIATQAFAAGCVNWASGTFVPNTNAIGQKLPDYGLYWFKSDGSGNLQQSVKKACDYADPKCRIQEIGYFDPKKPTIIFIHGWQPNTVGGQKRFDFCYQYQTGPDSQSPVYNTLTAWGDYNVAVFYWNQFADEAQLISPEESLVAAEAKIYTTQGSRGMEWKYLDRFGIVQTCRNGDPTCVMPQEDILDLAFDAYKQAMPADYHQEIRIAGQSLGAQVAIQLTDKIMQNPSLAQPSRLVLLDPYFSSNGKFISENELPYSVAQYNSETVADILKTYQDTHTGQAAFPIEVYRTSMVSYPPLGDEAQSLMNQASYIRLYPIFIKGLTGVKLLTAQHNSSIYLYFYSKAITPKEPLDFNGFHIDAESSDADVSRLMGQQRYQEINRPDDTYTNTWLSKFTNIPQPENS